jgi:predicted nucleotidyltransferase component of viral defense system
MGFQHRRTTVRNPWFTGTAEITTYELDELLGTKLRALYQRRKGRDLFDLWLCASQELLHAGRVVECFVEYMHREEHPVFRAEFERNLHAKESDAAFMDDIKPLLAPSVRYDPAEAMRIVREILIEKIPGDPWRGAHEPTKAAKPPRRGRKRP